MLFDKSASAVYCNLENHVLWAWSLAKRVCLNHPDFTIGSIHPRCDLPSEEIAKRNASRDMKRNAQYMRDQVTELLTEYGKIDILWFDFSSPGENGKGRGNGG